MSTTLSEFFDSTYRPLKLRGRSANTTRLYRNTIRQFGLHLSRPPTLDDLNDLCVAQYLTARGESRSPYTAEKERNQLLSLWRCAADRRLVDLRPCIPPAPLPVRVPEAWSIEQLRRLLVTAKAASGRVGSIPASLFWPTLISVLWESAERISAMLAVEVADYNRPRILVRAEHRKGGRRDRLYEFTAATCDLLDCVSVSVPGPLMFDWPLSRGYLWNRFGKIVSAAGLGGAKRRQFHQLRRSAATHFCARGGDPTALLDHSSPRVTKAYLDPRFLDTGPKPCDVLPDLNGGAQEAASSE